MKKVVIPGLLLCGLTCAALAAERPAGHDENWPQWRGPDGIGIALHGDPPVEWDESKNVRWKIDIPGSGHATPVIWGDRIFVQTAIETDERIQPKAEDAAPARGRRGPPARDTSSVLKFVVLCINRQDGQILWQRTVCQERPHQGTHATGTWASNSPVTDGRHVYAYFGSRGLYCLDMQGNPKWEKDFGAMNIKMRFGEGSSPALHGDTLVVHWDHEDQSFIVALDKTTGDQLWRAERDEITSWSTPLVVEHEGTTQVIVSATGRIRSYDLKTGKVIWECGGMTRNVIPTPVVDNGMVYVTSGFRGSALLAIRLSAAKGDITDTQAVVWRHGKDTPYVPSPLIYGDALYFLKVNSGVLSCLNAATGEEHYTGQRLDGVRSVYASPVAASGRIYIAGRNGVTAVIEHGSQYELLGTNKLDDGFSASPAIVGTEIYLRGHKSLYCIARD